MSKSLVSKRSVVQIAWPIIVANITIPLLGMVDTAVVGNLGDAALIGAIAIGSLVFGFVYWGFGFLRMSTTGLVAQADGAGDAVQTHIAFYRSALFALVIAILILLFQFLLIKFSLALMDGSAEVETAAEDYLRIRFWSAPATLLNFVVIGFFLGLGKTRVTLVLQVLMNGLNIILDLLFVLVFHWGVEGVAWATVLAEYVVLILGLVLIGRQMPMPGAIDRALMLDMDKFRETLSLNADLMLRTLCLLFLFAWFTNQSAKVGDDVLAANMILLQLITFSAFLLDGFALATERLVGKAIGGKDEKYFSAAVQTSTQLAFMMAILLSLAIWLFDSIAIDIMTNVSGVRALAREYSIWVIVSPLLAFLCFQLDGIFIGSTRSKEMRNAMFITLFLFLVCCYVLQLYFGNHGLWMALCLSYVIRATTLMVYYPRIKAGVEA